MDTPEIQMPQAGRRRGRYSDEFKRQVIAACLEPGISTAAVALSNGLNANLARRWVAETSQRNDTRLSKTATTLAPVHTIPAFIPIKLESVPPAPAILQHSKNTEWGVQCRVSGRHFKKIIVGNGH